ncbi:MAG: zinc-binding dehydrogenase [Actinomycetota bacterium]|nr:zinc-binding dehydrogenase [Acidimicrobiales bacterium]MEC8921121.1 zinc-binding dehydrogenase [Actinomycetota bacterium]MED5551676.1 zinc-binding dehydrogenase [Actinomycetota bacterium]MEE3140200.1 zinc-binding dehydrogenase [Actinomycetota bacterium]MEE3187881.1 zinc-binding dehydrogenase [Actinomycetota bacterium]
MPTEARVVVVPQQQDQPLEVIDVTLPAPGPHQVVVRQFASGICHSQLHTIHNPRQAPALLGHESTGEVLEVGESVTDLTPGDTVMVTWVPKDQAQARRQGGITRLELPDGRTATSINVFTWATHTIADEMYVVKVPDDIDRETDSIIGCAVITGAGAVLHTANVQSGDSVAIIGVGGVGLSAVAAAAHLGANPVIAVDLDDEKLDFAKSFGATHGVNAAEVDPVVAIRALTTISEQFDILRQPVAGVDYAFDCIGHSATMRQISEVIRGGEFGQRKGGTAVLVGVPQTPIELDSRQMFMGERSYVCSLGGSCTPGEDLPRFIDWHRQGILDLDSLVTQRYSIDDIGRAVEDLENGRIAGRSILVFD